MGRQSLKIDRSSVNSANHLRLYMEDKPLESETIAVEPEVNPVEEFKKGKAKREAKRKEVKVITEYVPPAPAAPEPELPAAPDVDSIASRVLQMLSAQRPHEEEEEKPRRKAPAKKKESPPPPPPPPEKYFGWC